MFNGSKVDLIQTIRKILVSISKETVELVNFVPAEGVRRKIQAAIQVIISSLRRRRLKRCGGDCWTTARRPPVKRPNTFCSFVHSAQAEFLVQLHLCHHVIQIIFLLGELRIEIQPVL
nr:hypothetical protein Iba_chr04fCG7760 [Ipomoea batatas]